MRMGVWLVTVLLMVVRVQFMLMVCVELLVGRKKLFLIQPSQLVLVKR